MRVLLIGGTGFVGYHAALELNRRGHEVVALARTAPKDDLLPIEIGIVLGDVCRLGEADLFTLLEAMDAVVFAAGADERTVPAAPAYAYFHDANVDPVVRLVAAAKRADVHRVVILGSCFSFFDRLWPQLRIAERHPYVRSRLAQSEQALAAADGGVDVITLELSYIFGSTPGRVPLWAPLVRYVTSRAPLLSPKGGTNMIAVDDVAEAIAGAVEHGVGSTRYLVGDENVTWGEFLQRLAAAAGLERRVITMPTSMVRTGMLAVRTYHSMRGKESGLDPVALVELQTRETFFDPSISKRQLGYRGGRLDDAFERTVVASLVA